MRPERPLLNEIQEREPAAQVALGDGDDEAQVGLDHLLLGDQVAALDALRQRDLPLSGQQLHAPDGAQVEPQGVQGRLDRQVDLRLGSHAELRAGRALGVRGVAGQPVDRHGLAVRRADDVDPQVDQVPVQLGNLFLGDLHLLQRGRNLLDGQEPALLSFADQRAKLVDLTNRQLVAQQHFSLRRHACSFESTSEPEVSLELPTKPPRAPSKPKRPAGLSQGWPIFVKSVG